MKYKKIYSLFIEKIEDEAKSYDVIISFKNLTDRKKFISKNKSLKVIKKFDLIPSVQVKLKKGQILKLENEKLVKQVEENQRLYLSMLDVIEILDLDNYRNSQIPYTGDGINVGIIDDGVKNEFPSISSVGITHYNLSKEKKIIKPKNNNPEVTHGTIMTSIIYNQFKDSYDNFIGIAPDVKIVDFNISNAKNEYFISQNLEILDKIIKENLKIDILLISLTSLDPSDGKDILSLACDKLVDKGMIIVSPAGNLGPEPYTIGSPSAAKKVITFGTLNKELNVSEFSGRGPTLDERMKPDFCLPGSEIKVPLSSDLSVNVTGTSVSASVGVGLIALIKQSNPELTYSELLDLLEESSVNLNHERTAQGHGIIRITDTFKKLDLYHDRIIPYDYLIKKSLKISLEFVIILIALFYFLYFFRST